MKCPNCQTDNPETKSFCADCGTQLGDSHAAQKKPIPVSVTRTLETPSEELKRGETFAGRYEIIEKLGMGGMGQVFRAYDQKLEEEVALKFLRPEIAADKKKINRFKNEIKIARKIAHRNVCRMYDLNEEGETSFITMEYVLGEDLKSVIRRMERLTIGKALSIVGQVAEGLSEAHKLGIVHRDLKPANIMIDDEGNAKIMDFGIARSLETKGMTGEGVIIGTPEYMSPEQVEGKETDRRSDIYSLGVILYEMVTGREPFEGDSPLSVAIKHKNEVAQEPKKLNDQIPEDLSRMILKCMEKEREQRYQSVEEILSELMNIEKGLPTTAKVVPKKKTITSKEFTVTFGLKKAFIPALVVLAAVVIIVVVLQILPKKGTVPITTDKPSLAVLYFKNNTGDEEYDFWRSALSDSIITDLQQSKYISVLSADQLLSILRKLSLLEAQSYANEDIRAVAEEAGVNHILQGSLSKAGNVFRIDYSLQEILAGEIVGSDRTEGEGKESIFSMVDELTKKIKRDLNLTQEQIAADLDREIGGITTSSQEAYKYYIEGRKYLNSGEYQKSIPLLQRAISIDPEFAMAYLSLANSYGAQAFIAERAKYRQKAFELSDRLPDREKYLIQGYFFRQSEKTYNKAIEAYENLVELYPDALLGYEDLAITYYNVGQLDRALELMRISINKNPTPQNIFRFARLNMEKGLYDESKEVLQKYLDVSSDNVLIRKALAYYYVLQRDFERAMEQTDKAFSIDPTDYEIIESRGYICLFKGEFKTVEEEFTKLLETKNPMAEGLGRAGLMYLYDLQGKFKRSSELCKQVLNIMKNIDQKNVQFYLRAWLGFQYLSSGKLGEAFDVMEDMRRLALEEDIIGEDRILLLVEGIYYVYTGKLDKAQQKADALKKVIEEGLNKNEMRRFYGLMGRIEYKRGNYSQAIEYNKKEIALYPAEWNPENTPVTSLKGLAGAYFVSGDLERAREEYEKILQMTRGRQYWGAVYARSIYMLGQVFEKQGDTTKAIEHYEKFLDLWKDADPGLPEVEDAKSRLSGLIK